VIGAGELEGGARVRRKPRHVWAKESYLPLGGMSLSADQTEQSRLPRAVRPDERWAFARRDGKAYPVHGVKTFKGLRDTGEAQSEIARVRHNGQFPYPAFARGGGEF